VIVRYLNIEGIFRFPPKAHPILVIDPDAVLPRSVSAQPLQSIAPGLIQILNTTRKVDSLQLANRRTQNVSELPASSGKPQLPRFFVRKRPDHILYRITFNASR